MTSDILKRAAEAVKHDHIGPGQALHCPICNPEGYALMPALDDKPGIWPDFIAPAQHINPHPKWEDPRLPDFRLIWAVARECGYSIGLHGSMKRDCDLIAAPWTEEAVPAEDLIQRLCAALDASPVGGQNPEPAQKPHGRLAWCLQINGWFKIIDISVMPRPDMAAAIAERDAEIARLRNGLNVAWADRDMHSAARAKAEEVAEEVAERLTARAEAAEAILADAGALRDAADRVSAWFATEARHLEGPRINGLRMAMIAYDRHMQPAPHAAMKEGR